MREASSGSARTAASFTPGPWSVVKNGWPKYFPCVQIGPILRYSDKSGVARAEITINEGPPPEAVALGHGGFTTMETALANARLIAAAPDLKDALAMLVAQSAGMVSVNHDTEEANEHNGAFQAALEDARSALAAAKGGAS